MCGKSRDDNLGWNAGLSKKKTSLISGCVRNNWQTIIYKTNLVESGGGMDS